MTSNVKLPEVRINFSWLLMNDVSVKIAQANGWDLENSEKYEEWTNAYRLAWAEKEKIILSEMQKITGLEFYLSVIDIVTVPCVIPKSQPLIIGFRDTPESVIETITHELCHTLLCDNKILSIYGPNRDFELGKEWQNLFGDFNNDFNALVHVPVHAICQKIFRDVLNDADFVSRDRLQMKKLGAESYLKSWDYVEKVGCDEIIEKLRSSYTEIESRLEKKR